MRSEIPLSLGALEKLARMPIPSFGKRRKAVEGLSTARSKTLDACSCLVISWIIMVQTLLRFFEFGIWSSIVIEFLFLQIRFILLQNWQGKTRLANYYVPLEESEKHKVEYEARFSSPSLPLCFSSDFFFFNFSQVHRLVVNRDSKFTNFVEVCGLFCFSKIRVNYFVLKN